MKIRFTWPLFFVLLVAGACAFFYSCRVKESFKGMQEKQATAKPAAAPTPKPAPASSPPKPPVSPVATKLSGQKAQPSNVIVVNPGASGGGTITLPGQKPLQYTSASCAPNSGVCTYTLKNGQVINAFGSTLLNVVVPTPAPSSSTTTKSDPAPFVETCPNGEQSTTGCCANGEPQGKYPCCPDGTPSRQGKCN